MENPGGHLGPSLVDSSQLLNGGLALFGMILLLGLLCSYPPPTLRSPLNQKVAC